MDVLDLAKVAIAKNYQQNTSAAYLADANDVMNIAIVVKACLLVE